MSLSSAIFNSCDPFAAISDSTTTTPLDWKETPTSHIFKVDLPGFGKDDIKLELIDGRILQISGERRSEDQDGSEDEKWYCRERGGSGKVSRKLRLPENGDVESVKAKMEDGVLTVTVAKIGEGEVVEKEKVRRVEISEGDGKKKKGKKGGLFCFGVRG